MAGGGDTVVETPQDNKVQEVKSDKEAIVEEEKAAAEQQQKEEEKKDAEKTDEKPAKKEEKESSNLNSYIPIQSLTLLLQFRLLLSGTVLTDEGAF